MNNGLFIFLVIVLSLLIILSTTALIYSIYQYNYFGNYPEYFNYIDTVTVDTKNEEDTKPSKDESTPIPPKNNATTTKDSSSGNTTKETEYILDSDSKLLTAKDIANLDLKTLNYAYNEIFARYGHDFKTKELAEYFSKKSWYKKQENRNVTVSELSDTEAKNLELIKNRINELKK